MIMENIIDITNSKCRNEENQYNDIITRSDPKFFDFQPNISFG